MKRRKLINLFGPSRNADPLTGVNKTSRRPSPLGISVGSAIAGLGLIALSGTAQADEFWWSGDTNSIWSDANWSPTAADTGPVTLAPDPNPDVVFSVVLGGANLNTNLGTIVSISSLRVNEIIPVTINGDLPGTPLTITGTGSAGPLSGINIETAAGLTTINANLDLGTPANAQTVTVNNPAGLVINGVLSGTDGLIKEGMGVLTLTGTNTYTGATAINAGTLAANSTNALGNGSATNTLIFNGGTLQATGTITSPNTRSVTLTSTGIIDTNSNAVSIAGIMSGVGGLTKNGLGTLTLTGVNTYTGATTINAGTLQLGNGITTGSSIAPTSVITVGAAGDLDINLADGETFTNSVINNGQIHWIANGENTQGASSVFSGTGNMLITAPGTTELLGTNTFTGGTTVNTTGLVLVGNPSAFGPGPLTITNGSIDTVGEQSLQINVGTYNQSGGEIEMHLGGTALGQYTRYNANGNLNLTGGKVYVYDMTGTYIPQEGDVQTIIQATGVRTGSGFSDNTPDSLFYNAALNQNISYAQGSTLLYPTITYDSDAAMVTWVQDSFVRPNGTRNQNSLGNALDNGAAPDSVTDFLNTQSLALLPGYYDLLAPDELTALYQMGFAASEIQNKNIQRHLERVRGGSPSETQYTETVTDSKGGMTQQQATRMSDANRWSVFLEGTDGSASVDGDANASGYDFDTRGATLGADMRVSDRVVVGILGAYTEADASLINGGSIQDEAYKGAIYATMYNEAFYVDALLGVASHSYEFRRAGLFGLATGETDAWEIDAMINTGYDIKSGNWTYGPTASIAYTRIELDAFTETGSLGPLRFPEQHQDSLRSELGAKISYTAEFGSVRITPQVRVGWQHEFMDSTQSINAGFVGGGPGSFSTNGPSMDEDRFVMGAGLTVQITPNFSIYGSYDGHIGSSDYDSNQVTAGIKFDF